MEYCYLLLRKSRRGIAFMMEFIKKDTGDETNNFTLRLDMFGETGTLTIYTRRQFFCANQRLTVFRVTPHGVI